MPEICRFYGIITQLYYGDHPPAHFHAIYGEYIAKIALIPWRLLKDHCHHRVEAGARMGAASRARLRDAFELASNFQRPPKIEPLP